MTIHKAERLAGGMNRTAEGLHLNGAEKFQQVGSENIAVYSFAKITFENLTSFDIDVLDNPVMQAITVIVNEYVSMLPEWMINEAFLQGALEFPDPVDEGMLLKAMRKGVVTAITSEEAKQVVSALNNGASRFIGKQIGKKLTAAIASAIAVSITKKIIRNHRHDLMQVRRKLVEARKASRQAKGGLGSGLQILLSAQGLLNHAAKASRSLQSSCPTVWKVMRNQLHGTDMVYFFVQDVLQEYVDRLSLLQNNPEAFMESMKALIESKKTKEIFFP